MTIRSYRDSDFSRVLDVWNQSLTLDSITPVEFVRRVLMDENLDPDGFLVAVEGGKTAGFCLCLTLRHPIEKIGPMEHRGFITAFGVGPEHRRRSIGTALFGEAENLFRKMGRHEIAIAPYPPNYFTPGVDVEAYGAAAEFLKSRGFESYMEALAMDALIGQFALSPEILDLERRLAEEGVRIEVLDASRLIAFMRFQTEVMPGDWVEAARNRIRETAESTPTFDSVLVAVDGKRIVGYCQFDGEHFGPFGVAEAHQGRGIGSVLLARTLLRMREHGLHAAFVLWTGERAAKGVYGRLGFRVTRRFEIFRKKIR